MGGPYHWGGGGTWPRDWYIYTHWLEASLSTVEFRPAIEKDLAALALSTYSYTAFARDFQNSVNHQVRFSLRNRSRVFRDCYHSGYLFPGIRCPQIPCQLTQLVAVAPAAGGGAGVCFSRPPDPALEVCLFGVGTPLRVP